MKRWCRKGRRHRGPRGRPPPACSGRIYEGSKVLPLLSPGTPLIIRSPKAQAGPFDATNLQPNKVVSSEKGLGFSFPNPLSSLEAAPGFEPGNNGFADRCLSHLAMPPFQLLLTVRWLSVKIFCAWKILEKSFGYSINTAPYPLPVAC